MALSQAQKQVLDKYNVSPELQDWMAKEFNEQGEPLAPGAPDFLMVMADHLQAAETYLESQRAKLNHVQNPNRDSTSTPSSIEEWQTLLNAYEEVVKEAWLRATGYWRIIDELVSNPPQFGITLEKQHVVYAFQKKNLALVEMLRWTKPEYFYVPDPPIPIKLWAGIGGGVGGAFGGLIGGIVWARNHLKKRKPHFLLAPFWFLIYALRGMMTGLMMGVITGASFGFKTGKIIPAIKMAFHAASYNPFSEPMGSKHKQAVDLKLEETLFQLATARSYVNRFLPWQKGKEKISIHFVKKEEVSFVLDCIKESAAQEKILSEVAATDSALERAFFGAQPKAEAIVGFIDDNPAACAIYFPTFYSVFAKPGIFVETLHVKKAYRKKGLEARLLEFLARLAVERDCKRLECLLENEDLSTKKLYQKLGAKAKKDWLVYRLEGASLKKFVKKLRD